MDRDLLDFISQCELFKGFTDDELKALIPYIRVACYEPNQWILKEGFKGADLYIIRTGKAQVLRLQGEEDQHHELETLGPNEWVGEMALLQGDARSASVQALEKTEVLILPFKNLPGSSTLYTNLMKKLASRLRSANEKISSALIEKYELTKAHNQISQVIIHLFILITIYVYMFKALTSGSENPVFATAVSSLLVVGFAMSSIALVRFSGYPLKFYGLTTENFWKDAWEGFLFTLPLLVIITIGKWVLITRVDTFQGMPLFTVGEKLHAISQGLDSSQKTLAILFVVYILLVPVQEFMARGLIQSCFRNFFMGPSKVLLAIVTANLLFGLFHGAKTYTFALSAFCFGMMWGMLFERQRSIVGCSVSHALIAFYAFTFLNYQDILID